MPQAITGLQLSNSTFNYRAGIGATVGQVLPILSPSTPLWTGVVTLGGADGAKFKIVTGVLNEVPVIFLQVATTLSVGGGSGTGGAYVIDLVGTSPGLSGSPFTASGLVITPVDPLFHQAFQAFPKLDTPLVDPDGHVAIPWYRLLVTLWQQRGLAANTTNTQNLSSLLASIQSDIAALELLDTAQNSGIATLESEVATLMMGGGGGGGGASANVLIVQGNNTGTYTATGIATTNKLLVGWSSQDDLSSTTFNWSALQFVLASHAINASHGWTTGTNQIIDPTVTNWTGYNLIWLYQ